jgi:dTDP-glucose 4,6-dehydratase/UDP-glucose 4-epimerase
MNILIVGSEGFIGKHLKAHLSNGGNVVYMADIVPGEDPNYIRVDADQPDYRVLFGDRNMDACINASGAANVQASFLEPYTDFKLNVANVCSMLNAIRSESPRCKFINLSSAAVYGNPSSLPITEEQEPNPLSPYGFHKLYSEHLCSEFHKFSGLPTVSLRIFSAYGPGLRKQLFWDLYQKILASGNKSVELFGTGNESRDFIFIHDLVSAIECVLHNSSLQGQVINVANGREVLIRDAVEMLLTALESDVKVTFNNKEKVGDPKYWRSDITCLSSLGYTPKYSMEEGLTQYVNWLKEIEKA